MGSEHVENGRCLCGSVHISTGRVSATLPQPVPAGKPDAEKVAQKIAAGGYFDPASLVPILRTFQQEVEQEGWAKAIEAVRGSLRAYPNNGGDVEIMEEVVRIEQEATRAALERAARAMCRRCAAGLPVAQGVANGEWLHAVLAHEGWQRCDASPIHALMPEEEKP